MLELRSQISGLEMPLQQLGQKLEPLGYDIGGGWEYDHGYMDYQMADDHGYQFLRIPFSATVGEVGSGNATVVLGTPFLLSHRFEAGIDHGGITAYSALWNQFSSPEEKDGHIDQKYVREGVMLVRELEQALLT
ncbi:YugN family protein [Natribacillus halophilus]|uniref:YugN-like family protein n=1 Tax=Natribacillus halophilus TaxID=549003 RepID=A0A1G8NLX8_9BACI|nr:YugN family protein [Natribacillus halophilus]SDI81204.1 YugN-like family protein [Natribacillus halophilus]